MDLVKSICFDKQGVMFSASVDGSVKKWNLATRTVAYSFEDRSSAVTSIVGFGNYLIVGLRSGVINRFEIITGYISLSQNVYTQPVSSLVVIEHSRYSSGLDGSLIRKQLGSAEFTDTIFDDTRKPIVSLAHYSRSLYVLTGELEILSFDVSKKSDVKLFVTSDTILTYLTATDELVVAGAKSGKILAWDVTTKEPIFILNEHAGQVNAVIADGDDLYSASDDKTIIKWSLSLRILLKVLKRTSSAALGHLGPVNSISLCNRVLFSAGSDLATRRWNTDTGKHEDMYFGHSKKVTAVHCYNSSVFSGSEDFSVLMYRPQLPVTYGHNITRSTTTMARSKTTLKQKQVRISERVAADGSPQMFWIVAAAVGAVVLIMALLALCWKYSSKKDSPRSGQQTVEATVEPSYMAENENTVVNTSMGLSKHAALEIPSSSIAQLKKIAAGGGGEFSLAKLMDPALIKKYGENVIQKVVFIKSKMNEEAFRQEVGIMVMLSTYPHFCQIIGYTVKPLAMILKYYPAGSLDKWMANNNYNNMILLKIVREIGKALDTMHSHYLAHCDVKPQNVLVDFVNGVPTCYLTDFGITQILSGKVIASKMFNVVNLRGLSIQYAATEAFQNFRNKKYDHVDFKKYDIFSFACVMYELLTRSTPWSD